MAIVSLFFRAFFLQERRKNAQVGFLKYLLPYYISRARIESVVCVGFENARRST